MAERTWTFEPAGIELMTIPDGISDLEFETYAREILGPPDGFPRLEKPA